MLFKMWERKKAPSEEQPPIGKNDFEMLDLCIDRILHTLDAAEFFECIHNVRVYYIRLRTSDGDYDMSYIENVYRQIEDAVAITNAFLDRLSSSGNLTNQTDVILKYKNYMPKESYEYFIDISGLRQICLSSCGVVFDNGKIYHYLCGEDIVPGDTVKVPVGDNGEEKLATVVSVGKYYRDYLPYPYDKMKRIH